MCEIPQDLKTTKELQAAKQWLYQEKYFSPVKITPIDNPIIGFVGTDLGFQSTGTYSGAWNRDLEHHFLTSSLLPYWLIWDCLPLFPLQ